MRWDLIDRFEILKKNSYAKAHKNFSGTEDFFKEHFPGRPIVPAPFFIEMIAQAGGVLFGLGIDFNKEVILAKISEAKFAEELPPPCDLVVEAWVDQEREEGAWILGTIRSKERLVARAKVFLVAVDSLIEEKKAKIVFNEGFLRHYDVYGIAKKSQAAAPAVEAGINDPF